MRALLLGLSGLLVASSGLALADTKLQTKPTPGASETRYFTSIDGLMDGNADVILKETRQGKQVTAAILDVCYPADKTGDRKDRFVVNLAVSGQTLSGTSQSLIDKAPVTVRLTRKATGDSFEFRGQIGIGSNMTEVASTDNSDISEREFQDSQSTDDGITPQPKDFSEVSPESVGVRLKLDDLFAARAVAHELLAKLPREVFASDWTRSHANFFRAVEIEKRMMFLILGLIVLVAAINIISTLVMAVTDKQADIAILRTLGAAPRSILQIFMVQGMVMGVVGTAVGVVTGIITALNVDRIVKQIEELFAIKFLSKDVYLIPDLPSDLQANDVIWIAAVALALSFLATIYPSWRAGRVNPAEALRYE